MSKSPNLGKSNSLSDWLITGFICLGLCGTPVFCYFFYDNDTQPELEKKQEITLPEIDFPTYKPELYGPFG